MSDVAHFDLDFEDEGTPGRYIVRLSDSPAGQADADFTFPYEQLELERLITGIGQTRRRFQDPVEREAERFGRALYDAAISGAIRERFSESLAEVERHGGILRLRLNFDAAPQLADLPWEFMFSSDRQDYVALVPTTPVVRRVNTPNLFHRPLGVPEPIRLALVVSNPPGTADLDVGRERHNVESALADLIDARRVELIQVDATRDGILGIDAHILHFVGHGDFDAVTGDGALLLEDGPLLGTELGGMMAGRRQLRMVVLNSCVGARSRADDPFAGLAHALLLRNIPAVVAMQFAITDRAAVAFGTRFYTAIAGGMPVDQALSQTRQSLRYVERNKIEWATPVLYLQTADARLFDVDAASASPASVISVDLTEPDADETAAVADRIREQLRQADVAAAEAQLQAAPARLRSHPDLAALEVEIGDHKRAVHTFRTAELLAEAEQWSDVVVKLDAIDAMDILLPGMEDLRTRAAALEQRHRQTAAADASIRRAEAAVAAGQWQTALDLLAGLPETAAIEGADLAAQAVVLRNRAVANLGAADIATELRAAHAEGRWHAVVAAHRQLVGLDLAERDTLDELAADAQRALDDESERKDLDAQYEAGVTLLEAGRPAEALELFTQIDVTRRNYRGVEALIDRAVSENLRGPKVRGSDPWVDDPRNFFRHPGRYLRRLRKQMELGAQRPERVRAEQASDRPVAAAAADSPSGMSRWKLMFSMRGGIDGGRWRHGMRLWLTTVVFGVLAIVLIAAALPTVESSPASVVLGFMLMGALGVAIWMVAALAIKRIRHWRRR